MSAMVGVSGKHDDTCILRKKHIMNSMTNATTNLVCVIIGLKAGIHAVPIAHVALDSLRRVVQRRLPRVVDLLRYGGSRDKRLRRLGDGRYYKQKGQTLEIIIMTVTQNSNAQFFCVYACLCVCV